MVVLATSARHRRTADPLRQEFGERYARELRDDDWWAAFIRHRTGNWERQDDVLKVAQKAVRGLTADASLDERIALILIAVRTWRAARQRKVLRGIDARPMDWTRNGSGYY